MLLDDFDLLLLRMLSEHRFLPRAVFSRFSIPLADRVKLLQCGELIASFGSSHYTFDRRAVRRLSALGFPVANYMRFAHTDPRPLRYGNYFELALTFLRAGAGIEHAQNEVPSLYTSPGFITSLPLRNPRNRQLLNSAQCAGFANWGDTAYMVYYLTGVSSGFNLTHELSLFHSLLPVFHLPIDKPVALMFAGQSYPAILRELKRKETEAANKTQSYSLIYRQANIPIHLLSCDEAGAKQLAWMRQPNYKTRTLNTLVGIDGWTGADDPLLDAYVGGTPFVFAADMDLRGVLQAVTRYCSSGIYVCALEEQIPLLDKLMPEGVELLSFSLERLKEEFGDLLYEPSRKPAQRPDGGHYYV